MNILRHKFFLEVVEKFYPEGVGLPVTTLPAPTRMTRQWVSSILVSWGYQVYHLQGMQPASGDRLEKLLEEHPNVSGSYDWEDWLKTTNPIMRSLYGNMPDPTERPLDWQRVLLESRLSGNPPAPMVESNPASWRSCLEIVINELEKRQPGISPVVPMVADPPTLQPSSSKRPHSPDVAKSSKKKRRQLPKVSSGRHTSERTGPPSRSTFDQPCRATQSFQAMQPEQPIASGSLSGNVSEPKVPPAPSSNSEGLSSSETNSWGVWLTPLASLSESELREPIEEGVEIWETFRKQSYCQQQDQQLLDQICDLQLQSSVDRII
ncbi:hypothetical protein EV424DRAFT_1546061 [Suillus variegatus]|nr:hypothetical protein EV424DRAFT_1546061 [Suillus variegatus]